MADTKYKQDPRFTSPIGRFKFPALDKPSYGTEKFPKPEGIYKTGLLLAQDDPTTKAFIAALAPVYNAALAEAEQAFNAMPKAARMKVEKVKPQNFFEIVYDKDTEEPTGDIEFRFSRTATGTYKTGPKKGKSWSFTPVIFDAVGRRMRDLPMIWGGSTGRIAFSVRPYFIPGTGLAGLSLRLNGAQIVELVTKGDVSASSLGFGAVEGGFSSSGMSFGNSSDDESDAPATGRGPVDDEIPF